MRTAFLALLVGFVLICAPLYAQEDLTAPTVVECSIAPTMIDVTNGAQTVFVTARITDDLSGFDHGQTRLLEPNSGQDVVANFNAGHRISGDALDGWYEIPLTIPANSADGTWNIVTFKMWDAVGNYASPPPSCGSVQVVSNPDVEPPSLLECDLAPTQIDVSVAAQTVVLTAHITDNLSGFDHGQTRLLEPNSGQDVVANFNAGHRISGDALDGWYEIPLTIPANSAGGTWNIVTFKMWDANGNYATVPPACGSVEVTSEPDLDPPTLVECSISPTMVDVTNGAQTVFVTARITDDLSGFDHGQTRLLEPNSGQDAVANFTSSQRVSGDASDGWYEIPLVIPEHSAHGMWNLVTFKMWDAVGNYSSPPPSCGGVMVDSPVLVEPTTWGQVKAKYKE